MIFLNKMCKRTLLSLSGTITILFALIDLIKDNVAYSLVGIVIRAVQGEFDYYTTKRYKGRSPPIFGVA